MKTAEEVQDRIRWLLSKELQRRVSEAQKRLPRLCSHNRQQALDPRAIVDGEPNPLYNRNTTSPHLPVVQTMGLCMYGAADPTTWPGDICDEPIDALRCSVFDPLQTKEQIYSFFQQDVSDLDWLSQNLPAVYELVWVLDTLTLVSVPWWTRLWWAFLRIRPEPVTSVTPLVSEVLDGLRTS